MLHPLIKLINMVSILNYQNIIDKNKKKMYQEEKKKKETHSQKTFATLNKYN